MASLNDLYALLRYVELQFPLYSVGIAVLTVIILVAAPSTNANGGIKAPYIGSKNRLFTRFQFLNRGWELAYAGHVQVSFPAWRNVA